MVRIILIFSAILVVLNLYSQDDHHITKSTFFELAGSGGVASLNYERSIHHFQRMSLTCRFGFSLAPIDKNNGTGLVFPILINTLVGKTAHKAEFGIGQGFTLTTKAHFFALTTPIAGYRFTPQNKPWFYRITYTPLISYIVDFQIQHWAGISIGYTFHPRTK